MRARLVMLIAALGLVGCGGTVPASTVATGGSPLSPRASASGSGIAALAATTVTYCTDGGTAQTLDMYEPSVAGVMHPLLMIVHGGSWSYGSSALAAQNPLTQQVAAGMLARGFAVASINYRLAPAYPWPAQIVDTRCAVRYLRATAVRWHLDPSRFSALGTSAGGHLVSVDALSHTQQPQWNSAQYAAQSSALQAVVDCWGPADLSAPGWSALAMELGRRVFGVSVGSQTEALRLASPVTYIHGAEPPFLIIQGSSDGLVPPPQSAELQSRLLAAGGATTLVEVAHAGHELRPSGGDISPTLSVLAQQTIAFLVAAVG